MTTPTPHEDLATTTDPVRARELDRAHVFHSWSAQDKVNPMVVTRAEGSRLWDGDGNELLDFSSQLVFTNIGHQHPRVVSAIQDQAGRLATIAPAHANGARSEAARLIASHTPGDLDHVFFTNGGTEAVEHAVRMARVHTGRHKVLSAYRSYHGATDLSINITADPRSWATSRATAGTVRFFAPYPYRSAFGSTTPDEERERALEHLEQTIALEGPGTIAAVILESIPGTAGIMVPPAGYLRGVREICDRHGIVFIADEVMAGFGRTGKWFAVDHDGVVPDLITFAKGVNSGYVPLGGVAMSRAIRDTFAENSYPGGLTYSGHPLACAAAVATIRTMEDEELVENAARLGEEVIGPALAALAERHEWIGEVRGVGAFWAVEFVKDRDTKEPLAPYGGSSDEMQAINKACIARGLLPFVAQNRVHVVPPLNISDEDARSGIRALDEAISAARSEFA